MTMTKIRTTVRKLLGRSPVVTTGLDVNTTQGLTLAGPGLALRGYDPVAYFTEGQPVIGKATYTATYNQAAYQFATEANLQAFKAHPERYVPQYGGFCAFGVSVGAKFDGDPQLWKIVDGKLYLNLNPDIQEQWEKDIPGHIGKADKHWPVIKDTTPAERG
jgi:YHS domain-containing protein